ncbi:MAG: hypothetical protein NZ772_10910 [Cyanobacteria bacterium]|nr:hypothetical protein [Cyanobacteriota bacterium]MDW8201964.1 Tic20 family protein [Cyanobacteriota bacterium SKYGB_h_bin112]
MTWRGSSTTQDRIFACLVYIVPVLEVLLIGFGEPLFRSIPYLRLAFVPLMPLLAIYAYSVGGIAVVQIAVFIGLFAGVIRNYRVVHFLRFHTMQALLIGIAIFLCDAVLSILGIGRSVIGVGASPVEVLFWNPLMSVIFVAVLAAAIYSVVQSIRGLYAELPIISEAAYQFVR